MHRILQLFNKKSPPITVGVQLSADNMSLFLLDNHPKSDRKVCGYLSIDINDKQSADEVKEKACQFIAEKKAEGANCCLVLDDKDYQLLVIEAPNVAENEMAEAVKWKIKDLVQSPLSDIVVDVFLQEDSFSSNKKIANTVVVRKDIVDKKSSFIESLGLNLKAIDIPELSYRNYIENSDHSEDSIALVVVKEMFGKLVVIHNKEVCFTRTFSVNYKGGLLDDLPESDIVLELQRSFDYYERQLKRAVPRKIIFCGENIIDDKVGSFTKESFSQEVFVEQLQGYEFQEEDILHSSRIIASYGASLRQNLMVTV